MIISRNVLHANAANERERAETAPRRVRRSLMSLGICSSAPRCHIQCTERPLRSGFVGISGAFGTQRVFPQLRKVTTITERVAIPHRSTQANFAWQEDRSTMFYFPLNVLACCSVMALFVGPSANPQVVEVVKPALGQTIAGSFCWKTKVCRGLAVAGECVPQGFICVSDTCGRSGDDGCWWRYEWACFHACESWEVCTHVQLEEWDRDCGAKCRLTFYNNCPCACAGALGPNTFEGDPYGRCR